MPLRDTLGLAGDPLYLVDGSSFLYRGYYAYGDLSRSDGFPTNALFIVIRILLRLLRDEHPTYALFLLDGKGPTFRHGLYADYKANRVAMPEPLAAQIEPLRRGVDLLGLPILIGDGFEADDYIASLAARFKSRVPVVIVASDKDLRQCLDANVTLWDPGSKNEKILTRVDFETEYGIPPASWPDFQALTGDTSDNIPGVPGIGPKTALDILRRYPTLEAVREHLVELAPGVRKKLDDRMDDVFLYRELTRLRTDLLPDGSLSDLAVRPMDRVRTGGFLEEYEFRSLARELEAALSRRAQASAATDGGASGRTGEQAARQLSLFGVAEQKEASPGGDDPFQVALPRALPDPAGLRLGLVPLPDGFAVGYPDAEFRVPAAPGSQDAVRTVTALAGILARAGSVAVPSLKDLLADVQAFESVPIGVWFDVGLGAYLLNPEGRNYAWERLKDGLFIDPGFDGAGYGPGQDGRLAAALAGVLEPRLAAAGLSGLLETLEKPLSLVLLRMQRAGIGIDQRAFAEFLDDVGQGLARLTAEIHALAGREFNLRSSRQLAEVLFDDLGLKRQGKTPGGAVSTSSEVLERLAGIHPLVDRILEYRKLEKLRSTYLEPLPKMVSPDGRLRTTFNQTATATGRLSSSNPNLQNIPIRGKMGRRMRACFRAAPGYLLAACDYSQIELRVLAHLSKDPALVRAFEEKRDIHAQTAALLFDKDVADITPDERRGAKTINFGLLYGMGPQKLSRELGIPMDKAREFIATYFAKLTTLAEFYDTIVEEARTAGFVTTLAGRRRLLPEIESKNPQLQAQAKRQAVNTVVQGSAADIIKMAMLAADADRELAGLGARLILQVHDELILEVPAETAVRAAGRLAVLMSGVVDLAVPLTVDTGVGETWAEAH
ncbi:MAG: DNA polymerase I [Desulfovibrio sp.]|nr:DNA polymerase I [Desulfovibrio sp.]